MGMFFCFCGILKLHSRYHMYEAEKYLTSLDQKEKNELQKKIYENFIYCGHVETAVICLLFSTNL